MESVGDLLRSMKVTVVSPDKKIQGTLHGQKDLSLGFRPGTYARYSERDLEHQCGQLGTLVWTGYRRGYNKVIREAGLEPIVEPEHHWDMRKRRYHEIRRQIEGTGTSTNGRIRVRTAALLRWYFRIPDGTIATLSEEEFVQEALSAVNAAVRDYRLAAAAKREKYFGAGAV